MAAGYSPEISELLVAWGNGDEGALNDLIPLVYPELRRIARQYLARRPCGETLQSGVLANEAYLKLIGAKGILCHNRAHFFALCAQIIRRLMVDYTRKRAYAKRGGDAVHVTIEETLLGARARGVEVLALDDALVSLARLDPRKSRVVELRFFGGLTVEEIGEVLQISRETVARDWKMAKTWLFRELTRAGTPVRS